MSEWQPIETAPKDGSWILLSGGCIDDENSCSRAIAVCQWSNYLMGGTTEWRWQFAWYDGGYYGKYIEPTHWMPLPSPPKD